MCPEEKLSSWKTRKAKDSLNFEGRTLVFNYQRQFPRIVPNLSLFSHLFGVISMIISRPPFTPGTSLKYVREMGLRIEIAWVDLFLRVCECPGEGGIARGKEGE